MQRNDSEVDVDGLAQWPYRKGSSLVCVWGWGWGRPWGLELLRQRRMSAGNIPRPPKTEKDGKRT
jgi:hypothetical protein